MKVGRLFEKRKVISDRKERKIEDIWGRYNQSTIILYE